MTRQTVVDGDFTYTIARDDDITIGNRMHALVQARVIDELNGAPIPSGITVTPAGAAFQRPAARQNVYSRVASGGLVGLAGVPTTVFPRLGLQPYEVGLTIRAEGYVPARVIGAVDQQVNFPAAFAMESIGDVALHRTPVVLRGRVVRRTASGTVAVPGATVRVTGIWRTLPTASVVVPAAPPNLVSVAPVLYAHRTSATGTLRSVTITPTVGDDKQLLAPAHAGSTAVRVSNRQNLSVGDVVAIDEVDAERREHLVIAAIDGATSPAQAATLTLAYPLAVSHARGCTVRTATVSAPGPARALAIDAIAGDTTLLCASVAGLSAPTFVEIDAGGGSEKEYHWLRPYIVTSDANGDYQLPPMSRVAQITVEAHHPPDPAVSRTVAPLYPAREQYLDFTFV